MKHKKILITGGKGMLATDIKNLLQNSGNSFIAPDLDELDITDPASLEKVIADYKPDLLINCAAYTAVDKCESDESHFKINGEALANLGSSCLKNNVKLVHFSTDYIFSGEFKAPIQEDEAPNPINKYGAGKLKGEENLFSFKGLNYLLLRVQWLYGTNGKNFVDTMLRLSEDRDEIKVVSDQIGRPTSTAYLAELVIASLEKDLSGVYHAGPSDYCSWYDFAAYILKDKKTKVSPIPSSSYPTPAVRPLYSVLSVEKLQKSLNKPELTGKSWKKLLDEYLKLKGIQRQ